MPGIAAALLVFGTKRKLDWHPNLAQFGKAASTLALLLVLGAAPSPAWPFDRDGFKARAEATLRSGEQTAELQSLTKLVCRLLLEKNVVTIRAVIVLAALAMSKRRTP